MSFLCLYFNRQFNFDCLLGLAEKGRKAYKQWFPRRSKTDKMREKAGKVSKTLAQIKFHVPTIPHRTAIIREFLLTIWRETVRRKSMGKISGTIAIRNEL